MAVTISGIQKGSIAEKKKISKGDRLLAVNGNEINDVLDYRFYQNNSKITLEYINSKGKQKRVWYIFFKKCFCWTGETRIMENSADWFCFLWHSRITFGICCTYRKSGFCGNKSGCT